MAKRPMRRMTAMNEDSQGRPRRPSMSGSLTDSARDMSFNAVRVAAETAKAALVGMQELARAMADMAAPAARQPANDTTRGEAPRGRRSAAESGRRATRSTAAPSRPAARATRRKSSRRRAA